MSMDNASKQNPNPRPIRPDDESYREVMMLFSDQPVKPRYWFEEFGDHWTCSCGQYNKGETCSNCGLEKSLLRRLFVLHRAAAGGDGFVPSGAGDRPPKAAGGSSSPAARVAPGKPSAGNSASGKTSAGSPASGKPSAPGKQKSESRDNAAENRTNGRTPGTIPASDNAADNGSPQDEGSIDPAAGNAPAKNHNRGCAVRLVIIAAIILLILASALLALYYIFIPDMQKQDNAAADAVKGNLIQSLPPVIEPLGQLSDNTWLLIGDALYDQKQFTKSIEYYEKAGDPKNDKTLKKKILDAKYGYVKNSTEKKGKVYRDYLDDLVKAKYPGAQALYETAYEWKADMVANNSSSDDTNDQKSVDRTYTIYFHCSISGGPPDRAIPLHYEVTWPDGSSERSSIAGRYSNGEDVTINCTWTYPSKSSNEKVSVKLYNSDDHQVLASDSVILQP